MYLRRTQLHKASLGIWILSGGVAFAPDVALGQPVNRSQADSEIEEVVVTGSRIRRQDYTSISPLVTLDAEQITLSGVTAVEDLLNDAPQLVPYFDRSGNNPGSGAAFLNLRGLGPNRTLVTLNGRRMAPADEFGAADINTIPSQLIERVEIVTGGASTVYGSDAVAGVVNFILDEDFEGFEVTGQYDTFEAGDGDVVDLSAAFGLGDERWHLTGFVNWQERDPVLASDRAFTNTRLLESFSPGLVGTLQPAGSATGPAGRIAFPPVPLPGTGGQPVQVTFDADGTPRPFDPDADQYNFQPANYLQVPLERESAALFGRYRFTDTIEGFAELLYSRTSTTSQLAPSPAFVNATVNVDNPLLTPSQRALFAGAFDPDGDGLAQFALAKRLEGVGPRRFTREADTTRAVLGLEGELPRGWQWQATYSLSDVRGEGITGNAAFGDRFEQALLVDPATGNCLDPSNGCVPFNPFGSPVPEEALGFIRTGDIAEDYSLDEDVATLVLTGDAIELPAGALGIATGIEWRELSSSYAPDTNFLGANVLGTNSASAVGGTQDVTEVFLEALVPLLAGVPFADYLGVEAGYRYSDYRFSGVADNWKIGADWSPISSLRFRVMAQRAVRAPNIDELFREPRVQPTALVDVSVDRCSASADPVGNGLADICVAQGIAPDQLGVFEAQQNFPLLTIVDGGNTDLDPESADTLTAGVVIQPGFIDELSISIDYYNIEIDNAIGATPLEGALNLCFESRNPESPFCRPVVRAPSGDIAEITNPQFNLASLRVEGVDLAVNYRLDLGDGLAIVPGSDASIALQVLANHAMQNTTQATPGSTPVDCAGFFGGACSFGVDLRQVTPEYRTTTRLTYYSGPLSLALNWQWIGSLQSQVDVSCRETPQFCYPSELEDIDSRNYLELSGRLEFGQRAEIYGGVSNLTEEDPPLMGFGQIQSNTAPALYDVFGRRYFLGFRYRL
ncbi:MAG: TonB-dependent receptor [Halieaceae bacterium]|jgi:outer membrane receptor protein involved in Fe transport|nr:TonB-dependent receptor [Halieaceae bacterium]